MIKDQMGYECVIQTLRTANVLWRASRRFFRPFNLTEAQFNVLHLLGQRPKGMSQRELSDLLVVDRSNVTLLLDRMSKHGWIKRHNVPGDRRVYRVSLTPSGQAVWKQILPNYVKAVQETVDGLPMSKIQTTLRTLQGIESKARERK